MSDRVGEGQAGKDECGARFSYNNGSANAMHGRSNVTDRCNLRKGHLGLHDRIRESAPSGKECCTRCAGYAKCYPVCYDVKCACHDAIPAPSSPSPKPEKAWHPSCRVCRKELAPVTFLGERRHTCEDCRKLWKPEVSAPKPEMLEKARELVKDFDWWTRGLLMPAERELLVARIASALRASEASVAEALEILSPGQEFTMNGEPLSTNLVSRARNVVTALDAETAGRRAAHAEVTNAVEALENISGGMHSGGYLALVKIAREALAAIRAPRPPEPDAPQWPDEVLCRHGIAGCAAPECHAWAPSPDDPRTFRGGSSPTPPTSPPHTWVSAGVDVEHYEPLWRCSWCQYVTAAPAIANSERTCVRPEPTPPSEEPRSVFDIVCPVCGGKYLMCTRCKGRDLVPSPEPPREEPR